MYEILEMYSIFCSKKTDIDSISLDTNLGLGIVGIEIMNDEAKENVKTIKKLLITRTNRKEVKEMIKKI